MMQSLKRKRKYGNEIKAYQNNSTSAQNIVPSPPSRYAEDPGGPEENFKSSVFLFYELSGKKSLYNDLGRLGILNVLFFSESNFTHRELSQITFALGVGRWSEKHVVCYIKSAN